MKVNALPTPALLVEAAAFDHNVKTMSKALPGARLRPHVKAFKSTALAARLIDAGHTNFCCATTREMVGMAEAGLGHDLLLANELVDPQHLAMLAGLARADRARITVAVDSVETVVAAATAGVPEVLIDVNVGMPRCGCVPELAGRLAELSREKGMAVRGVMGYEDHIVGNPDRAWREEHLVASMDALTRAHELVGGDIVSAGGTGTYDINRWATEIQAGSYVLMDSAYNRLGLPFRQGLFLLTTVISVSDGWAVSDGGLKSLGMDHGDPTVEDASVLFCSDEHVTFVPDEGSPVKVGDKVRAVTAHIDPTIARHRQMYVVDGDDVVDTWPVDLAYW